MKTSQLLVAALMSPLTAAAAVVITSAPLNLAIPDQSNTGLAQTLAVPDSFVLGSVSVSLNLSVPAGETGWLGDLYAYVQHDTGLAVLLNRPGRNTGNLAGYADSQSASLTFSDTAANGDIHSYRLTLNGDETIALTSPLTGTWQPDGRATDPGSALTDDARTATLTGFNGLNANGTWTLFVADLSTGGRFQLDSWELQATPVPEPAWFGLAFGGLLAGLACWRRRSRCRPLHQPLPKFRCPGLNQPQPEKYPGECSIWHHGC